MKVILKLLGGFFILCAISSSLNFTKRERLATGENPSLRAISGQILSLCVLWTLGIGLYNRGNSPKKPHSAKDDGRQDDRWNRC
jgi:hypothetical protein